LQFLKDRLVMASVQIPWWGKICAKIVLSRMAFGYTIWQRLGLFRHGQMDRSEYAIGVFQSHIERAGLDDIQGCTLLELGPGDSISTAIIAAAHGARTVLVDAGSFVRADLAPYLELAQTLADRGLRPPDLTGCGTIGDVLMRCQARYLTEGLESLRELETESIDLIFSQAVLEHVRKADFLETLRQCRRVLKQGGVCSHQIDLRDHLGGALNNLRFEEKLWESQFFSSSGFYTNRIQFSSMVRFFHQAGFAVNICEVRRWEGLPTRRDKLAKVFQPIPDEELQVSGFDVLLRHGAASEWTSE
jgi:SAM-dependent methyltransferase